MRKIMIILAVLFLAGFSSALTLKSGQTNYEKGSEIILSGSCDLGDMHRISAELGNKKIFDEQINCFSDGKFDFKYPTSFLDPSGNWRIKLFTPENETEIIVIVKPIPESAFYRITFLSPAGVAFKRGETIFISIEMTDSGEIVNDAQVVMYDVFGRKIYLKAEGNGIYDVNYGVPFNAPEEKWGLTVVAQKEDDGKLYGGERLLEIEILPASFIFQIIEPVNQTYEQSDKIPIKAKVTYSNGVSLTQTNIEVAELRVGQEKIPFEINSNGELILAYAPKETGNQIYRIYLKDNAGNESEHKIELIVTCSATCMVKNYGLIVLVVVLVLGVVSKLFYTKINYSVQLLKLKNEKAKTTELIKDLQREYFEKAVMPAKSYKSNMATYKSKLIELDEKIKQMEHKIRQEK
ncbi:MAG: hypothetical protein CL944_02080 [Candidatus Diapherotrites archaeon]|uniref:Uncharacterized protein n=1 Tax=Candidatus Iainarchaeum sp. TaxID=3101447 RepID=A0A2D6LPY3_9ARCH|nr:hypothetical protein [Candidatus Diapherotrites archaeon]|tara:strand:- start:11028 stop:12248 length:1221 start_codon:yes stop_codon:yes gene_type:complete